MLGERLPSPVSRAAFHVVLPLFCGFLAYLLWRPTTLWMFSWLGAIGLMPFVESIRAHATLLGAAIPTFALLSLPAACWSYAFCSTMGMIWHDAPGTQWSVAMTFAILIGVGGELAQIIPTAPGVYDNGDMVANLFASVTALVVASRDRRGD